MSLSLKSKKVLIKKTVLKSKKVIVKKTLNVNIQYRPLNFFSPTFCHFSPTPPQLFSKPPENFL